MAQTPSVDDLAARIAAMEKRQAEAERKTFSNFTVTDPLTGVKMLTVDEDPANGNAARIQLRDQAGSILLDNDTASGWGFAHPILTYPMYPYSAFKLSTTLGVLDPLWNGGANVLSRKVGYGIYVEGNGSVSQVEWKLTWLSNNTAETVAVQQTQATLPITVQGTYLLPSNQLGKGVVFTLYARVAAGSGSAAATPLYIQTRGQNV